MFTEKKNSFKLCRTFTLNVQEYLELNYAARGSKRPNFFRLFIKMNKHRILYRKLVHIIHRAWLVEWNEVSETINKQLKLKIILL